MSRIIKTFVHRLYATMGDQKSTGSSKLMSVAYEVHGKVQDVFFRQYTLEAAAERGIKGTVENTDAGTVAGIIQGEQSKFEDMKNWLSKVGSPESVIEKCEFKDEREITNYEYEDFKVTNSDW